MRNQNGKLKNTPLKPLTLQNRYARAFCAHRNSRARGSTSFETFKAQKTENCTPPHPCPPVSHRNLEARARARGSTFKAQKAEICTPPRPCPPAPGQKRGQSTGAGEYEFRDFQGAKCRNLYSPAPVPQRPEWARGSTKFKKPKSVLPRTRAPQFPGPRGQSTATQEYE